MVENNGILEGLLFEWEKLQSINCKHSSDSKPNHQVKQQQQQQQWSMVMIRDTLPRNDLSIFPPINHENLNHHHIHQQHHQQQQQSPPSISTPLPPPDAADVIASSSTDVGIGEWLGIGLGIVRAKIAALACHFGYKNGTRRRAFWCFGWVIGVAAAALMRWLWNRVLRRRCREESVQQLKMIITEKDEKIRRLLEQIAQMNQVLVARHKALASKLTG